MVKSRHVLSAVALAWAYGDECPPGTCPEIYGEVSLMQNLLKVGGGRSGPQLGLLSETSASLSGPFFSLLAENGPMLGLLSVESRKEAGNRLLDAAVNMLKNGATPDVVQFVESTTTEITSSVFPSIEDEHATDQNFINDLLQQFQDAVDQMVQESQGVASLHETRAIDSYSHMQCRSGEAVACARSRKCEEELEVAWLLVEREETTMRNIHWRITDEWCEHPPEDAELVDDPMNWDNTWPYPQFHFTQDVRDFRRVSAHEFHLYMLQKPIVHQAWYEYNEKIVECANLESHLEHLVSACDEANTQAELSACNHAEQVRQVRNDFGHSWIHVNESYWTAVEEIRALEEDRKREWETLHVVTCLLTAIHTRVDHSLETGEPCVTETSNPEETSNAITHCHEVAHNLTEHLNIDYGTPPDPPPLPDPASYPCTAEYIEEEFAGFTTDLRARYSQEIQDLESYQTGLSSYGWAGCAAPRICHACTGMYVDEPNPDMVDDAHTCKPHEEYLLPGQTDVDSMRCLNGDCVPISARCNGEDNCADGSDEQYCEAGILVHLEAASECPAVSNGITFHCGASYNAQPSCVSLPGARCNGYSNCADGSDEMNCLCGPLSGVTAEATSGRTITVEQSFTRSTGVFHDRSYEVESFGSFENKMFIKASNDDKDTPHDHAMWKIRLITPAKLYLVKLTVSTHDLPWLLSDGWTIAADKAGPSYSGVRATKHKDWAGEAAQSSVDSYGPGVVYEKDVGAGTTIVPGNGGNDGSFLIFLEKPCDHEMGEDEAVVAPTHFMAVVSWPAHAWNTYDETARGGSMSKCFPANTVEDVDGDGYLFTSCCEFAGGTGMTRDCNAATATRATHRESTLQCEHQGGRLCTAEEALSGVTVSKGCSVDGPRGATGSDLNRLWTSTPCTGDSLLLTKGNDPEAHAGTPDGAREIQFIDLGAGAFETDGEMVGVSFSVSRASQTGHRFQIYRPVSGNQYELVAESDAIITPTAGITMTATFAVPLSFQAGDYVGWVHTGQGTMPFSGSDNSMRWKYGIEGVGSSIAFNGEGGRTYSYEVMYTANAAASTDTDPAEELVILTKGHDSSLHSGTPDGSSAIQFIDLGAGAFENAGEMVGVSFAVARANQAGNKFQIYRPVDNNEYELVAESDPIEIESAEVGGTFSETFATPLPFQAGDFIGWVHTGQGTMPYTRSENSVLFKYGVEGLGSTIDFPEGGGRTYAYEVTYN